MIAYTKLKLSREEYDDLTNDAAKKKKQVIVFQFIYKKQADTYPTLRAYAMEFKHQEIPGSEPVDLLYLKERPDPDLTVPAEQVTGDLQATYKAIQTLKKDSNDKPEHYDYLLFTPKIDGSNQHIFFEMSVVPTTKDGLVVKPVVLNPSPPYGAR